MLQNTLDKKNDDYIQSQTFFNSFRNDFDEDFIFKHIMHTRTLF